MAWKEKFRRNRHTVVASGGLSVEKPHLAKPKSSKSSIKGPGAKSSAYPSVKNGDVGNHHGHPAASAAAAAAIAAAQSAAAAANAAAATANALEAQVNSINKSYPQTVATRLRNAFKRATNAAAAAKSAAINAAAAADIAVRISGLKSDDFTASMHSSGEVETTESTTPAEYSDFSSSSHNSHELSPTSSFRKDLGQVSVVSANNNDSYLDRWNQALSQPLDTPEPIPTPAPKPKAPLSQSSEHSRRGGRPNLNETTTQRSSRRLSTSLRSAYERSTSSRSFSVDVSESTDTDYDEEDHRNNFAQRKTKPKSVKQLMKLFQPQKKRPPSITVPHRLPSAREIVLSNDQGYEQSAEFHVPQHKDSLDDDYSHRSSPEDSEDDDRRQNKQLESAIKIQACIRCYMQKLDYQVLQLTTKLNHIDRRKKIDIFHIEHSKKNTLNKLKAERKAAKKSSNDNTSTYDFSRVADSMLFRKENMSLRKEIQSIEGEMDEYKRQKEKLEKLQTAKKKKEGKEKKKVRELERTNCRLFIQVQALVNQMDELKSKGEEIERRSASASKQIEIFKQCQNGIVQLLEKNYNDPRLLYKVRVMAAN